MNKTDLNFMLTFAGIVQKVESGEDFTEECEQVKSMPEEDRANIAGQLLDRVVAQEDIRFLAAVEQIGYFDPDFVQDFVDSMKVRQGTNEEKQNFVRRIIERKEPYKTMTMDDVFWKNITLIAVNCRDNELLGGFIRKVEQLRDGMNPSEGEE